MPNIKEFFTPREKSKKPSGLSEKEIFARDPLFYMEYKARQNAYKSAEGDDMNNLIYYTAKAQKFADVRQKRANKREEFAKLKAEKPVVPLRKIKKEFGQEMPS